jgi:membrane protein
MPGRPLVCLCTVLPETMSSMNAPPAPAKSAARPRLTDWRTAWALIKGAVTSWVDDYAASMGAALSYYTFFSLAPLLLIVVSVAGLIFGAEAARGQLMGELSGLLGPDAAKSIEGMLAAANRPAGEGTLATVIGVVAMLIGATTVFAELQDSLDRIWRAPARDKTGGILGLLRARVLSFGIILGLAFLLVVSLVMSAALSALGTLWEGAFPGWELLAQALNFALGFALITVVFAIIYKLMPRVRVDWHDVWVGALVTSLLFSIGRVLIGLYIGKAGLASPFGAAGSLVVVLIWVYYSAQVFLLGAEFTWVYARTLGSQRSIADPHAATAEVAAQPEAAVARVTGDAPPDVPRRSQPLGAEPPPPVPVPARGPSGVWLVAGAVAVTALALGRQLRPLVSTLATRLNTRVLR